MQMYIQMYCNGLLVSLPNEHDVTCVMHARDRALLITYSMCYAEKTLAMKSKTCTSSNIKA